jgi:hypothetical protein
MTNSVAVSTGWMARGEINLMPCREVELIGGPCRDRTYDQLIKSQLLYQLS